MTEIITFPGLQAEIGQTIHPFAPTQEEYGLGEGIFAEELSSRGSNHPKSIYKAVLVHRNHLDCHINGIGLNGTYQMAELVSLTEQLQHFSSGERQVAEAMLREVLPKLHQIAVRELRRERSVAHLSPTELINEVWLRNLGRGGWQVNSRDHFYAIASLAMRRVLVDCARSRMAQRRGGSEGISESDNLPLQAVSASPESMVQIGMLMDSLEKVDKEWARVVDMHYYAGFTLEEIAEITGLSLRQIRLRWEKGRDWLKDHIR